MLKNFIFILFSLLNTFQLAAHDIHVSVTEIYETEEGGIEVSIRIFFDDLLAAVGLEPGQELPKDYTSSDELIQQYLNKSFSIKINGIEQKLNYVETTAAMPAVWVSLKNNSIASITDIQSFEIENTILTELFDDQTNMINISIGKFKKKLAMNNKKKWIKLDF